MRRFGFLVLILAVSGCASSYETHELTNGAVTSAVERLDALTLPHGGYDRPEGGRELLVEVDGWGRPLQATYTKGGFAETVTVRSAGPDGVFGNTDDIVQERHAVNLAGVGRGARDNVGVFVENGSRGLSKGLIQGVKDSFKRKKNVSQEETN